MGVFLFLLFVDMKEGEENEQQKRCACIVRYRRESEET
jgi:hypothetical protein